MKRAWIWLAMAVLAQPATAEEWQGPYYGPMKRWHGIGYKFGYEDRTEADGSWRIDAAVHGRGDAIDIALYRAAEKARDAGYRYVFLLGGDGYSGPGMNSATLYARPSHDPVPPVGCRSKKVTGCYTADVAELLRILGGPDGRHPGVPIPDHRDEFGRNVYLSGYGTAGVATPVPGAVARSNVETIVLPKRDAPVSIPASPSMTGTHVPPAPVVENRAEAALRAAQPVRRREPKQGWTISD